MSKEGDEARRQRLQVALRENLKKRKAQQRARVAETRPVAETGPDPAGKTSRNDGEP